MELFFLLRGDPRGHHFPLGSVIFNRTMIHYTNRPGKTLVNSLPCNGPEDGFRLSRNPIPFGNPI
jgi:hypothetical protein